MALTGRRIVGEMKANAGEVFIVGNPIVCRAKGLRYGSDKGGNQSKRYALRTDCIAVIAKKTS